MKPLDLDFDVDSNINTLRVFYLMYTYHHLKLWPKSEVFYLNTLTPTYTFYYNDKTTVVSVSTWRYPSGC